MPTSIGGRATGYNRPVHRARRQGPDVEEGGGGGGGTPPTAPSDVTTPTVAWRMIGTQGGGWGGTGVNSLYNTWVADGFAGFGVTPHQIASPAYMQGTTAINASSLYNAQKAMEGIPGTWNSNSSNQGIYRAVAANPSNIEGWTQFGLIPLSTDKNNWWDDAGWAARATQMGGWAAGTRFLGGRGIYWDSEFDGGAWNPTPPSGRTLAELYAKIEARGYECGIAMFTAYPGLSFAYYSIVPGQSYFDKYVYNPPNGITNLTNTRMLFQYGVMRAGAQLGSTGRWAYLDHHLGYRFDTGTPNFTGDYTQVIKTSTQGTMAQFSQTLPAASRNHWMNKIDYVLYTWASTDNTGFYQNSQLMEPAYSQMLEIARKWSMGGRRWEFVHEGQPPRISTVSTKYPNMSAYYGPAGRIAGMQAAKSTSTAHSATAPALTASKSGSGTTRTISGTASHAYGIRTVKAYIYPSGTQVHATMTFNLAGGSPYTTVANSYMDWTLQLTGVATGNYAIVTAYSTLDQQKSTVLAL